MCSSWENLHYPWKHSVFLQIIYSSPFSPLKTKCSTLAKEKITKWSRLLLKMEKFVKILSLKSILSKRLYTYHPGGISVKEVLNFHPPKFPIYSRSVEQAVKLITEASRIAYSLDSWLKFILLKENSRKSRSSFSSKKHFKV